MSKLRGISCSIAFKKALEMGLIRIVYQPTKEERETAYENFANHIKSLGSSEEDVYERLKRIEKKQPLLEAGNQAIQKLEGKQK